MASRLLSVLIISLVSWWSPLAAGTLNFDDLDASAGDIDFGSINPYHGFTWFNFSVYTTTPGFPGFNNGIVSAPNAAYSGGQTFSASVMPVTGTISAATPFDFVSGYLGAGYYNNLKITVEGLLDGSVRYSKAVTVGTQGARSFSFGFDGINAVEMFASMTATTSDPYSCGSFNCTQFTLDNLTFTPSSGPPPPPPPPPAIMPEPSTLILLSLGTLTVFAVNLRNRNWARSRNN